MTKRNGWSQDCFFQNIILHLFWYYSSYFMILFHLAQSLDHNRSDNPAVCNAEVFFSSWRIISQVGHLIYYVRPRLENSYFPPNFRLKYSNYYNILRLLRKAFPFNNVDMSRFYIVLKYLELPVISPPGSFATNQLATKSFILYINTEVDNKRTFSF